MSLEHKRAFLQVEVQDWCTNERLELFRLEYLTYLDVFASSPQIFDQYIRSWVRLNQVRFLQEQLPEIYSQDTLDTESLVKSWSKSRNKVLLSLLSEERIVEFATTETLMLKWALNEWGHRLESIYLERKSSLDQVSCSLIRTQDPLMAAEIYHRLRSDKIPFDQLSWQFGEGPERKNSGFFPLTRAANLPDGFLPLLKKLQVGETLKPHRVGKWTVILQLHELVQAQFNDETQQFLLKTELDAWTRAVSGILLSSLE